MSMISLPIRLAQAFSFDSRVGVQMNHNEDDEVANKGVGGLHEQMRKNQGEIATTSKDASQRKEDVLSNFK